MKEEKKSESHRGAREDVNGIGKGEYLRPELVELGELSQLIRGNTGAFNDGNSPNPRVRPN